MRSWPAQPFGDGEGSVLGPPGSGVQPAMPFAGSNRWMAGKRLSVVGEVGVPVKRERRKDPESWGGEVRCCAL